MPKKQAKEKTSCDEIRGKPKPWSPRSLQNILHSDERVDAPSFQAWVESIVLELAGSLKNLLSGRLFHTSDNEEGTC